MLPRTTPLPLGLSLGMPSRFQRHLFAVIAWIAGATALTLVIWMLMPRHIAQDSHPSVQWLQAQVRSLASTSSEAGDWQNIEFPDTWAARQSSGKGVAEYRLPFQLSAIHAEQRATLWALRIDRLSFQHRIWLNGYLIHSDLPGDDPTGRPLTYLATFSPELLKAGRNELLVEVRYGSLGGLSQPILGLADELSVGHNLEYLLSQQIPLMINVIGAAFAISLILVWSRRRSEVAMAALGLMTLVISIRNCTYYIVHGPTLPAELSAWLYFTAQTTATVLLVWFAQAMADKRSRILTRMLWFVQIVFPIVAGIGAQFGHLAEVRAWLYPGLLGLMVPVIWLLLGLHRRFSSWSVLGMALGIAVSLVAGVHDYLRLVGTVSIEHIYWLPLTTPITLASYGMVLMHRFIESTNQAEELNIALEAKVDERTQALQAANAAKGHFLAAASHDLRQPVAAVGLLSGLLKERLIDSPLQDMTQRLCESVRAMEGLLNGLLDLSRLEAGAIRPSMQAIDLQAMFNRIYTHEHAQATQKGLALRIHPTAAHVHSDPVLLEQMVRNLVGNALRYTQTGGVLVAARRRSKNWVIQVWDTGHGIAQNDQQRIFEDFVQLDNPERNRAKGLGLGLAIVQRAAKLLGLQIGLNSRLGLGSCFSITVPAATPQTQHKTTHVTPGTLSKPLADRHIVILDDDDTVRLALRERLREWGACTSLASSIEDLDELLHRVMNIDLLLTDYRLHDGDGFQAIDLFQSLHPGAPAVLITGDTPTDSLRRLQTSGVPVLHKPFQAEALLQALLQTLNQRESKTD